MARRNDGKGPEASTEESGTRSKAARLARRYGKVAKRLFEQEQDCLLVLVAQDGEARSEVLRLYSQRSRRDGVRVYSQSFESYDPASIITALAEIVTDCEWNGRKRAQRQAIVIDSLPEDMGAHATGVARLIDQALAAGIRCVLGLRTDTNGLLDEVGEHLVFRIGAAKAPRSGAKGYELAPYPPLITISEACDITGLGYKPIHRLCTEGCFGDVVTVTRVIRIRTDRFLEYFDFKPEQVFRM